MKAEELMAVDSRFTGEGALGSSWLLRYDKASRMGYLNGITISVADTDGSLRYDTSFSPYFDGELAQRLLRQPALCGPARSCPRNGA
ncbi:hypothetical protein ACFSTC_36595 [Nonomuraea ferruginea]